ncbi:hypothetical protein PMAYCL1PPCAC_28535, partial [Pristionchus mayeri]
MIPFQYGTIGVTQDPTTCDLTITCSGYMPLSIYDDYSTTIEGDSPRGNPDDVALFVNENGGGPGTMGSAQFQYMRCVGQNWIPYIEESSYLADNNQYPDDPSMWVVYNAVTCTQLKYESSKFAFLFLLSHFSENTRESASVYASLML